MAIRSTDQGTSAEKFLGEMNKLYEREWEIKNTLENKANNLITISGTVISLLFGFGSFFSIVLIPENKLTPYFLTLFLIAMSSLVGAIFVSIISSRLQNYWVSFDPQKLVVISHNNGNGKVEITLHPETEYYTKLGDLGFVRVMTEKYAKGNYINNHLNEKKVKFIKLAYWLFLFSMTLIPLLVLIILLCSGFWNFWQ